MESVNQCMEKFWEFSNDNVDVYAYYKLKYGAACMRVQNERSILRRCLGSMA